MEQIGEIVGGDDTVGDNIGAPNILVCDDKPCLDEILVLIEIYVHLMDGNDKPGLLAAIQNAPTQTSTYHSLKTASPFLSDEVLTAMVHQTRMPLNWVEELLIDHVPLTDNLHTAIDTRATPFPTTMLLNIEQTSISRKFSDRKRVEMWISGLRFKRQLLLQQLLNTHFRNREMNEAIQLLEDENTLAADKHLTQLYIQQKDYVAASNKVSAIPEDGGVNTQFKQIQNLNISLKSNGKEYCEITPTDSTLLEQIVDAKNANSGYAETILYAAYGKDFEETTPVPPSNKTDWTPRENRRFLGTTELLRLIPNPTSERTTAYLQTPADQLFIQDLTGKIIAQYTLSDTQESVVIPTATFKEGMYLTILSFKEGMYLTILSFKGKIMAQNKMVVIH